MKAKVVSPLGRGVTDNVRKSSSQILICEVSESGRVLENIQPRTALRKIETPELLFFFGPKKHDILQEYPLNQAMKLPSFPELVQFQLSIVAGELFFSSL